MFSSRVDDREEFILSFVHSVNRRPVYDTIRIEANRFLIVKSRFDSFGGGMPDCSRDGTPLRIGRDGWIEAEIGLSLSEINFYVGWVANHTINIRGREYRLIDFVEPGTPVSLRSRRTSIFELLKEKYISEQKKRV